jgi:hypothetical protein
MLVTHQLPTWRRLKNLGLYVINLKYNESALFTSKYRKHDDDDDDDDDDNNNNNTNYYYYYYLLYR